MYFGETVSLFGAQVTAVALPLVAAISLGASSFAVGLLNASAWLPIVVFGVFVGVFVDRHSKWRILLGGNVIRAAVLAVIPILWWRDHLSISALLAVAFVVGTANVAFDVCYQSSVPDLVPDGSLDRANSLLELSRSTAMLVGPLMGGALVTLTNPAYLVAITVASYLVASGALLNPRVRRAAAISLRPTKDAGQPSLWREIREGQAVVWRSASLRVIVLAGALTNVFVSGLNTLLVLFIVRELGLPASYVGFALAATGAGAIAGAMVYTRLTRRVGDQGCIAIGLTAMAAGGIALPCAGLMTPPVLVIASEAIFGFGAPVLNIALVTMRQRLAPRRLLGRVNATARVLIMSTLPLGAVAFGTVGQSVGVSNALWVTGGGLVLVCAVFVPLIHGAVDTADAT